MPEFISNTIQLHVVKKENDDYKFLVLQRANKVLIYPQLWQVITGTVEEGETAKMTALREIYEETGLRPIEFWTLPYVALFYDTPGDFIHASPVFGALVDGGERVRLSSEHKNYLWLDYEECINKLELPTHKEGTRIFYDYILKSKLNKYFKNRDFT